MLDDYPSDDDGDALRRLKGLGADLSKPMEIDFNIAVPNLEAGKIVADAASAIGFSVSLYQDAEDHSWTCDCTRNMVPDYFELLDVLQSLNDISQPHGGYCDGWGSYGNGQ